VQFQPAKPAKEGVAKPSITLRNDTSDRALGKEGYGLKVTSNGVSITAYGDAGLLYGLETLLQMMSCQSAVGKGKEVVLRVHAAEIRDVPRFGWRGAHLDVCRHFFPKEFVKKYLDILAFYKLNTFHWHLTDDQGWRLEIKKYPKLTSVGAWRADRESLPWDAREPQRPGENASYGGYYTQEDVREIVEYARQRSITIVPEIEMPAHAVAALAAYPEFSCSGGPFTVVPGGIWPDTTIFCAGNDRTFEFLENVLSEVIGLFPGQYIHVGGDEADKSAWKACPRCHARMEAEGLHDAGELQSYFMKRIEKFVVGNKKRLIGWDEILEGGLPPEATVMSWRGIVGGIAAAKAGHNVIMSPTSHCYFDYYQGRPEAEPEAIGSYLPLSKVYEFEPVPDSLTALEATRVLGGQANLWTEYVPTPAHAEYMLLPRLAALAEAVWTPRDLREWVGFSGRVRGHLSMYRSLGWNAANSLYHVHAQSSPDTLARSVVVTLSSELPDHAILYTLDSSLVTPASAEYNSPLVVRGTSILRAAVLEGTKIVGPPLERRFVGHNAAFKKPVYRNPVSPYYPGGGTYGLVDMLRGTAYYRSGEWQGFARSDIDITIDLGEVMQVSRLAAGFLQNMGVQIFFPNSVEFALSNNDSTWISFPAIRPTTSPREVGVFVKDLETEIPPTRARYVHLRAKNLGVCPPWHADAGREAWIFIDEVIVE
jgi:hexosaminidase